MLCLAVVRRAVTAAVLIICLGIFLCPAVGKPEALVPSAKQSNCCAQEIGCAKMSERVSKDKGCGSEQSQGNHCCPVPCSTLVLFCPPIETLFRPAQTEQLIFASETFASVRAERPPVPPPRA
jgi:hypothetical protein